MSRPELAQALALVKVRSGGCGPGDPEGLSGLGHRRWRLHPVFDTILMTAQTQQPRGERPTAAQLFQGSLALARAAAYARQQLEMPHEFCERDIGG